MAVNQKVKGNRQAGFYRGHTGTIIEVGTGVHDGEVRVRFDNRQLADDWMDVDDLEVIEGE